MSRVAAGVAVGLLAGVLAVLVETGLWSVLGTIINPHFAPEIGPFGVFVVVSVLHSAYFVPPFLLLACPFLWLARRTRSAGRRFAVFTAALIVAGTVYLIFAAQPANSRRDAQLFAGLSVIPAAIGATVILSWWKASDAPGARSDRAGPHL